MCEKVIEWHLIQTFWGQDGIYARFLHEHFSYRIIPMESCHLQSKALLCQLVLFLEWQDYFQSCRTLNNGSLKLAQANSQCSPSSQLFTSINLNVAESSHYDTVTPTVFIRVSEKLQHDLISIYIYIYFLRFQVHHFSDPLM